MRVYVATKWSRKDEAAEVMAALRGLGHEITHDWTLEADPGDVSDEARRHYFGACAAADVDGVLDADVMLLLHDAACRGAFVELGVALAHGVKVLVVGGDGLDPAHGCPLFYYLPEVNHVPTVPEAVSLINAWGN
jgi:hypothetical protein